MQLYHKTFEKIGVDIQSCVEQTYDGASVMSGRLSGVQMRIEQYLECAIYVHWHAHRLNLVVVDSCKAVTFAADFLLNCNSYTYSCLVAMFMHVGSNCMSLQKEMYPDEKAIELKSLSETRWSAQIAACHTVKSRLDVILKLLDRSGDESNRNRAVEAA